jgi:hypothetical protein
LGEAVEKPSSELAMEKPKLANVGELAVVVARGTYHQFWGLAWISTEGN